MSKRKAGLGHRGGSFAGIFAERNLSASTALVHILMSDEVWARENCDNHTGKSTDHYDFLNSVASPNQMLREQRDDRALAFSPEAEAPHSARVAIKAGNKIVFVETSEIRAIEARGNYVVLLLQSNSLPVREAISSVAEKLKAYGFVRIHRSHIVNAAFVAELKPLTSGEYLLRTRNGKTYTVSRTYKDNLRSIGDLYIGVPNVAGKVQHGDEPAQ